MLKRNLIAIAIVTLGLGITSAFGQAADWEIKPAIKNPTVIVKKTTSVKNRTETVNNNENRTKSNSRNKMGNFEIQGISETNKILDVKNSPRETATGQSTGKMQVKQMCVCDLAEMLGVKGNKRKATANLGDTGTHEVGHKQRRRGN